MFSIEFAGFGDAIIFVHSFNHHLKSPQIGKDKVDVEIGADFMYNQFVQDNK